MKKIVLLLVVVMLFSCTDNSKVKTWGGTEIITLEPGKRLINVTWKDRSGTSLWILTKQDTTKPSTFTFEEKSSLGIMEGKLIIKEQ
jgi:hypothetical protein